MKLRHILLIAATIFAASCEKADFIAPDSPSGLTTITATIDIETDTKVGFTDGAAEFFWTKGDKITFVEDGSIWNLSNDYVGQAEGQFVGSGAVTAGKHVVYGASAVSYSDANILFTLPATYGSNEAPLALDASYADPYGNSHNAPMLATIVSDENELSFRHLGGVIAFEVVGLTQNTTYQLTVDADKKINGEFTIDPSAEVPVIEAADTPVANTVVNFKTKEGQTSGYVYVPMPTGTYSEIDVKVNDGTSDVIARVWDDDITIERRVIKRATLSNSVLSGITQDNLTTELSGKSEDVVVIIEDVTSVIPAPYYIPGTFTGNITFILENVSADGDLTIRSVNTPGYIGEVTVSIANSNQTLGKLWVEMPDGDVVVKGGNISSLTTYAKENTTTIDASASVGTLVVKKGNVVVAGKVTENIVKDQSHPQEKVNVVVTETGEIPSAEASDEDINIDEPDLAYICANGGTYTLTEDIELNEILVISGNNVVIDGGGYKITSTAARAINITNGPVTIKNLTIEANASGARGINIIQKPSNVTIDNVTVNSKYAVVVSTSAGDANINITGSTLTGSVNTIEVHGPGAVLNIDQCTLNCTTHSDEPYSALVIGITGTNAQIKVTNSTINVDENNRKGLVAADPGTILINGSASDVEGAIAAITYSSTPSYYTFATIEGAIEFAKSGDNILLLKDVKVDDTIVIAADKNITLDLNGKTMSMVQSDDVTANHEMILNKGNLTIKSSVDGGKLSYNYTGTDLGASYAVNTITTEPGSTLTINSGTIENLTYDKSVIAYAIDGRTNGSTGDVTVNIDGGTITSQRQSLRIFANSTTKTGTLTITSGEFIGRVIVQSSNTSNNIAVLNISGGTFNTNDYKEDVLYVGGSGGIGGITASISGGTFNGEITETSVTKFIKGGTFIETVSESYLVDGYECVQDGENWVVQASSN